MTPAGYFEGKIDRKRENYVKSMCTPIQGMKDGKMDNEKKDIERHNHIRLECTRKIEE